MTDKKETEVKPEEAASQQPDLFQIAGKEFDLSTDQGKKDAQLWAEAFSTAIGKQGQELGELRKEVEPLRRFGVKKATPDKMSLLRKVEQLAGEGEHQEAYKALFEYTDQLQARSEYEREKDKFWGSYVQSRPDIFEALPEDMARDYVFSNYEDALVESEDAFGLIDRVLKPKVKGKAKAAPAPAEELGYTVQSGHAKAAPAKQAAPEKKSEKAPPKDMQGLVEDIMIK